MYKNTQFCTLDDMKMIWYERFRRLFVEFGFYKKAKLLYRLGIIHALDKNSPTFWDDKFKTELTNGPIEDWRINQIIKNIDENKNLLNIGVGSGKLEKKLFSKKPKIDYCGTDITRSSLSKLQQQYPNRKFIQTTLNQIQIPDQSFDQVLLIEVLEHIQPFFTFKFLKRINQILRKNGKLIISAPINEGLEKILPENPNAHMRMYSINLLKFELQSAGFKVIKIYQASAFSNYFFIKNLINNILFIREPNNIIFICQKI